MRLQIDRAEAVLDDHPIIKGVELAVAEGEVVGLIGPNGSGKSTLLRCVYRALRPVAGVVRIEGDDVWGLSAREAARRTAAVVQERPSEFDLTVWEVAMMGRMPHKGGFERDSAEDDRMAWEALDRVGMIGFRERVFTHLSGGEKQRVLLARALAQQPRLLVLDEPTNHLDIRAQLELLQLICDMRIATVTALHDLNLAAAYCDRIYVLDAGRVVASGLPEEVLTPALVRDVFGVEAVLQRHPLSGRLQIVCSLETVATG
jgi:iron complex transport system ATP-binding protein